MIYLKKTNPDTNENKYYTLLIQQDLFGKWSLVRQWGRLGTKGQTKIDTFDSYEDALAALESLEKEKCRRGYSLRANSL